jgi:lipopolysaccharide/colanic/teichoic acid biosynthesis glycosyltransferase
MTVEKDDGRATGGHKAGRVTATGKWLRETRLDEVPQLWNILRGDMSFVGPRPPLRAYVERFPAVYQAVLRSRPGVTGLATLKFHRREARLMSQCVSAAESDRIYTQRCVPTKARLDLIYQRHQSLLFDLALMIGTVGAMMGRKRNY